MKQLLYVTSPSYAVEAPKQNLPDWSPDWYTLEEKKRFLTTETVGFFFLEWAGKADFVEDVVWMTTSHWVHWSRRTDLFVDVLSFGTFATMVTTGQDFEYIQRFDIVFGGCEYTVDAVEAGNFTGQDEHDLFMQRMEELSCKTLVWPNPRHALWYCEKWQLIQELDRNRRNRNAYAPPGNESFETGTQFSHHRPQREGSGCSQMRHFHTVTAGLSKRALTDILAHNRAILDARKQEPTAFGMLWLVQELVEPLRRHGEWRVFVVGGKIIGFNIIAQDGVLMLSCTSRWSKARRDHAMAKLHEYVLLTLKVLVPERRPNSAKIALRDFVRVDMSFIAKPNGQLDQLLVNEIEMQPTELILQLIAASERAPEDPPPELAPSPKGLANQCISCGGC
ncbi:hypothetical protein B0H10DRAFT_2082143, partial [Mycena sp. CBHHK59/15]